MHAGGVGAAVVVRVGEVGVTAGEVEGLLVAVVVGRTDGVGEVLETVTTALDELVVLQGGQVLEELVTVVANRVAHDLTALFDGAGRQRDLLVLLVAVAHFLAVLLDAVLSVTLGQTGRVVLLEEVLVLEYEGTATLLVHGLAVVHTVQSLLVGTAHLVVLVTVDVVSDVVGTTRVLELRVATIVALAHAGLVVGRHFAAFLENGRTLQVLAYDQVAAVEFVLGLVLVAGAGTDPRVRSRRGSFAAVLDHGVAEAVVVDVGVDVFTLAVEEALATAVGVEVLVEVRSLLVLLTTLLTHHGVLLALVATVAQRLALLVTVVLATLFLVGLVDVLVVQHRQHVVTAGRLVLLHQDEALVDATLQFPVLGQFGRVGVVVTLAVLVLEVLGDRGVCTTVLVLELVGEVSLEEELRTAVVATGAVGVVGVDLAETVLVLVFVLLGLADLPVTGAELGALVRVLVTAIYVVPAVTVFAGVQGGELLVLAAVLDPGGAYSLAVEVVAAALLLLQLVGRTDLGTTHFGDAGGQEGLAALLHLLFRVETDRLLLHHGVTVAGRVGRELFAALVVEHPVVDGVLEYYGTALLGQGRAVGLTQGVHSVVLDFVLRTTANHPFGQEPALVVQHVGTLAQGVFLVGLFLAAHVHLFRVESLVTHVLGHGVLAAGSVTRLLVLGVEGELLETLRFLPDGHAGLALVAFRTLGTVADGLAVGTGPTAVPGVVVGGAVLPLDAGQDDGDEPDGLASD